MLKMASTIARSSSAPKLLKQKKKKLLTPPFYTKPVSKLPSHLFLPFFFSASKSCFSLLSMEDVMPLRALEGSLG